MVTNSDKSFIVVHARTSDVFLEDKRLLLSIKLTYSIYHISMDKESLKKDCEKLIHGAGGIIANGH